MLASVRAALLALGLGALAAPVVAQDIHPMTDGPARNGFYLGLGVAATSMSASCDGCSNADGAGMFGTHIKLGGTLAPSVRLGADLFGATTDNGVYNDLFGTTGAVTENAAHLMLALSVYPYAAGNFWFQVGLGGVVYTADVDGDQKYTARGFGEMVGIGYDLRVGKNGSISPYLNLTTSTRGKLYDANGDEVAGKSDWGTAFVALGVDYVFH